MNNQTRLRRYVKMRDLLKDIRTYRAELPVRIVKRIDELLRTSLRFVQTPSRNVESEREPLAGETA